LGSARGGGVLGHQRAALIQAFDDRCRRRVLGFADGQRNDVRVWRGDPREEVPQFFKRVGMERL